MSISVELERSRALVLKKGKRGGVREGLVVYPARAWPPRCPCSAFRTRIGCRHVFRLLAEMGWSDRDVSLLPHSSGPHPGQSLGILDAADCLFCLDPIGERRGTWTCAECLTLMHEMCAERWLRSGNGCPACRAPGDLACRALRGNK